MEYLIKNANSQVLERNLSYNNQVERFELRGILIEEQQGFCAYSERFINHTDECHIDHFDPRLKGEVTDNYNNWYAVIAWMNTHKPKKIDQFLPILQPNDSIKTRIIYEDGIFKPINPNDDEAQNLIKFLGFNRIDLVKDRQNHINRIRSIIELCDGDMDIVNESLRSHRDNLSFATALRVDLNIDVTSLV